VIAEHGGDPASLSPICPVATSTDHSVGVDRFGTGDALADTEEERPALAPFGVWQITVNRKGSQ
jgi:aconitase A